MSGADQPPPPPRQPDPEECCGGGCDPCIFDYYDRALARWRERVLAMGADPDALLRASEVQAAQRGPGSG